MTKNAYSTSLLFDLKLFSRRNDELLKLLENHLFGQKNGSLGVKLPLILLTPNSEQVIIAQKDPQFQHYLQQADILIPDGIGLVFASKILSIFGKAEPLAENIPGVDVVAALLKMVQDHQSAAVNRVVVVGGRDYAAKSQSGDDLATFTYQGQTIYWLPAYQDISQPTPQEEAQLQADLKQLQPDLVFVAFGAPYQEQWLIEHHALLSKLKVELAMVVGGSFDFLLEKVPRAPRWVRGLGLEWLFRLINEPWRWRRQLKLLQFMKLVVKSIV